MTTRKMWSCERDSEKECEKVSVIEKNEREVKNSGEFVKAIRNEFVNDSENTRVLVKS